MITIEKAVEILRLNVKEAGKKMPSDVVDAVNLGIEAMLAVQDCRSLTHSELPELLPGEIQFY